MEILVYRKGKQKTAYEIMSGDWSSDVCSSDLYHTDLLLASKYSYSIGSEPS